MHFNANLDIYVHHVATDILCKDDHWSFIANLPKVIRINLYHLLMKKFLKKLMLF